MKRILCIIAAMFAASVVYAQTDVETDIEAEEVEILEASAVTAQKTLVVMDIDKITYKVEDDVDSKTSTILDMLRKVPMVSVDGQDNITVNGSSSFQNRH